MNKALARIRTLVERYCEKSGTVTHPDKEEEVKHRTWICACDDMQIYKYCHCLLFVNDQGMPITEYLPPDHEGRKSYGVVHDPTPDKGRPLRQMAEKREQERKSRPS